MYHTTSTFPITDGTGEGGAAMFMAAAAGPAGPIAPLGAAIVVHDEVSTSKLTTRRGPNTSPTASGMEHEVVSDTYCVVEEEESANTRLI